ncbi:MAG: type II toxin-antitoxin system RelB/DinJ family antitoxin [Lachnospiraceae bacterium]|nr:type II toxin-antitoxin system RelB/DinJ family antitoxin [Lachnospiraceae bacterium]
MARTMVNFRIDEEIKRKMESVCTEMGLNILTVFYQSFKKGVGPAPFCS